MPTHKRNNSARKTDSMYHRSLVLALTAFLLVALVRIPAVSADDTQDKALESLDCWVLANKDEFVVKNVGEVSAQVTSIKYSINGNQYWEDIIPDVPLISYESHIFPISHEYDTIGVLSARGVLYPVKLPPTASFDYSPSSPKAGEPVSFDASASSDPDGTIVSYGWDLDGDGAYDDATGVATTKSFASAGVYTIGLEVTDDDGLTGSTTRTITVEISDTVIEGTTEPNAPVTIIVSSETRVYEIFADDDGHFSVVVPDLPAGTHNVTVVAGDANRNRQADGPYTGGWEGYAEGEKTDSVEAGSSAYFNLSLTYDPFLLAGPASDSLTQGWKKITTTGTTSYPFQDTREVIAHYDNGDIIYQTVKDSLIGYNFEQRVTEYTTVTSSLSASARGWVDTGETYELWPLGSLPQLSPCYRWVYTGSGWVSSFYKKQYNEVEDWKALGYSVTSNYGTEEYQEWNPHHEWVPGYYTGGNDYRVDWTTTESVQHKKWISGYWSGCYKTRSVRYWESHCTYHSGYWTGCYKYVSFPCYPYYYKYWDSTCHWHSGYWTGCYKYRSEKYYEPRCTWHSGYYYYWTTYETKSHSETFDHYSDASAKKSATGGSLTYVWNSYDAWISGYYESHSETFDHYSDASAKKEATNGTITNVWDPYDTWVASHWEGAYEARTRQVLTGYTASKQVPYKTWVPKFSEEEPDIFSEDIRDVQELWSHKSEPVMTTETYTRYHIYSFEDIAYSPLSWSSKQTTITATWLNGYTGEINLSVNLDGLGYSLNKDVLVFGSSASATLILTPTSASTHYVKVNAYDSNGYQETYPYTLSCISVIPNNSYSETYVDDSDEEPDETTETIITYHSEKVVVTLYKYHFEGRVFYHWFERLNYYDINGDAWMDEYNGETHTLYALYLDPSLFGGPFTGGHVECTFIIRQDFPVAEAPTFYYW